MHPDIDRNVVDCAWDKELLEGRDDKFVANNFMVLYISG